MDPVSADGPPVPPGNILCSAGCLTSLSAQTAALSNYFSGATEGRPEQALKMPFI